MIRKNVIKWLTASALAVAVVPAVGMARHTHTVGTIAGKSTHAAALVSSAKHLGTKHAVKHTSKSAHKHKLAARSHSKLSTKGHLRKSRSAHKSSLKNRHHKA